MPVLKKLDKTVKKISQWQEDCAELQHGLRILLGESGGTSISDVSVKPMRMGKVKKNLDEAGEIIPITSNQKIAQAKADKIKPIGGSVEDQGRTLVVKDAKGNPVKSVKEEDDEDDKNSSHKTIEYRTPVPVLINKTIDILKGDKRLQSLVNGLFKYRAAGNIGKSDEYKTLIDKFIDDRGLDPITVYASYDLDLGEDDVDLDDVKDKEDSEENSDNNSETEEE